MSGSMFTGKRSALWEGRQAQNLFPSNRKNSVLSAREWIHGPANAHANQQKKKQRPDDVFDAVVRPPAAQESERDGDE